MRKKMIRVGVAFVLAVSAHAGFAFADGAGPSCARYLLACPVNPSIQARLVKSANAIRAMASDQQRQLAVDLGLIFESDRTTKDFRGILLRYNYKTCGSEEVLSAHVSMIEAAINHVQSMSDGSASAPVSGLAPIAIEPPYSGSNGKAY